MAAHPPRPQRPACLLEPPTGSGVTKRGLSQGQQRQKANKHRTMEVGAPAPCRGGSSMWSVSSHRSLVSSRKPLPLQKGRHQKTTERNPNMSGGYGQAAMARLTGGHSEIDYSARSTSGFGHPPLILVTAFFRLEAIEERAGAAAPKSCSRCSCC